MTTELQLLREQLNSALTRLAQLEQQLHAGAEPGPRWRFLVQRHHPWRRQLSIKGRNLTVGQLVSTVRANNLSLEDAAADLALPLDAIQEALAYHAENQGLIELEACEERRRLAEKGLALEPKDLSR
jgi:uncharacterized protein (DUF433 family)